MENIIIAASGTGGHIYPGIVIASELKERGYNPVFFINNNGISLNILKNSNYQYETFNLSGMPRIFSLKFPIFCLKLFLSTIKAFFKIKTLKAKTVIATGGYIGFPAVISAKILGKSTFIHEQNIKAGKANRFLNRFADKIFITYKNSEKCFDTKKIIFSGCPIRKEILNADKKTSLKNFNLDENSYVILIFGGSLGATKLNEISFDAIQMAYAQTDNFKNLKILHISGENNYEELSQKAKGKNYYKVIKYMHNIADGYGAADIIISRGGAGAVCEIRALNKPAILIPFAYAAENHQFYNALEIKEENFVEVIEEKNLTKQILVETLLRLKNSSVSLKSRQAANNKLPQEIIADIILNTTVSPLRKAGVSV